MSTLLWVQNYVYARTAVSTHKDHEHIAIGTSI